VIVDNSAVQKFQAFFRGRTKEDKVAILHDTDPDGISSAVILSKAITRMRGKAPDLRHNQETGDVFVTDETIALFDENNITKVITLDLGTDQYPEPIKELERFCRILVIDHHKTYSDLNSDNTTMIKSIMVRDDVPPEAYCTAKLTFDLCNSVVDVSDLDWVSCIGLIGDFGYKPFKKYIDGIHEKYGISMEGKEIYQTDLGKLPTLISESVSYSINNVKECFDVVYNAKTYKDVLNSNLEKYHAKVRVEIKRCMMNYKKDAEYHDDIDLIWYEIKSPYLIKSNLSTLISSQNMDKTLVIAQEIDNGIMSVSLRRQDKTVAVNDLVEKAIEGLEGAKGGGHLPAAAGKMKKEDYPKFKETVLRILRDLKDKK